MGETKHTKEQYIIKRLANLNMKERDKNIIKIEKRAKDKGWETGKPIYKFLNEIDYHIWHTHNDQIMINQAFENGFNSGYKECEDKLEGKDERD